MQPILEVKNLKAKSGDRAIVRDVSFVLREGETVALVGESGSGKTTIAHSISKLNSDKIQITGEILFKDKNILSLNEKEMQKIRGKEIGMVFQDPMTSLNPTMRVCDQIMESVRWHEQVAKEAARERALDLLKLVGIPDPEYRLYHYPHLFSGGQRQRLIIAMAIACNPKILIADEPTSALDVTVQAQILELIKSIQNKFGISILFITHDLNIVEKICDRVIVLNHGEIVETGSVAQIFSSPQHEYTKALLEAGYVHFPY